MSSRILSSTTNNSKTPVLPLCPSLKQLLQPEDVESLSKSVTELSEAKSNLLENVESEQETLDILHDSKATLAEGFDSNSTHFAINCPKNYVLDTNLSNESNESNESNMSVPDLNMTIPIISSIPNRIDQTQPEVIEAAAPVEHVVPVKKPTKKKPYKKKKIVFFKSLVIFSQ